MPYQPGPEQINPGSVAGRSWALARPDGKILVPYLVLLPKGRIGGSPDGSAVGWHATEDCLQFFDRSGLPSASFVIDGAGSRLVGSSRSHGAVVLQAIPDPLARVPPVGNTRRPNLVLVRAGPGSLHPFWEQNISDADRNWDLCVSWYGDPAAPPDGCDYFFATPGTKFEGLAKLLSTTKLPWQYQHVWMPDDDLMVRWADINRMFALCTEYDLMLAQPSLEKDSYINHLITRQDPTSLLRFTSFVEIMAPVFSHAALHRCAPTFTANRSGYGLDHVWPHLIGSPPNKIAIIDAISVVHTRPIGATYGQQAAIADGIGTERAFGVERRYRVLGHVPRIPEGPGKGHDMAGRAPLHHTENSAPQR